MTYERETIRKDDGTVHVTFTFAGKGSVTLPVADYRSGQAMIDAAMAWAAKQ